MQVVFFLHIFYYHKPLLPTPQAVTKYVYENRINYLQQQINSQIMVHIFKTILNSFTSIHRILSFTTDVKFIFCLWMDMTAVKTRDII